jgi:flagellar biosynthetic protein FlhB
MADQEQDRSEQATPFKLEEARKRGTVAKSSDFITLAVLTGAVAFVYALGWWTVRRQLALDQAILQRAGRLDLESAAIIVWLHDLLVQTLFLLAPLFAVIVILAIVSNLVQTGPVLSAEPLSPDFDRLNPATGFKRVFSMRTVYDSLRSLLKLVLVGGALALAVWHLVPWFIGLSRIDPVGYGRPVLDQMASVLFKLLLAMLVIALADVVYTRWEFARRMRMSRREMKDEHKQREGDPRIRARLRQLRQEMLKRSQAMRKLPGADVVITNPTHIAVALSYRHGEMAAPRLVAKGAGDLAERMKRVARRHAIPIVENRVLARALYFKADLESAVPEDLYPHVARILVWVFSMRRASAAKAAP